MVNECDYFLNTPSLGDIRNLIAELSSYKPTITTIVLFLCLAYDSTKGGSSFWLEVRLP